MADHFDIKITRPFAIFVEPSYDIPGAWLAHIVGHELDNLTQGQGPEDAVFMAFDLLKLLTGFCSVEHPRHDLTREIPLEEGIRELIGADYSENKDDDGSWLAIPSIGCTRCDYIERKDDH